MIFRTIVAALALACLLATPAAARSHHHHRQHHHHVARAAAPSANAGTTFGSAPWLDAARQHLGADGRIVGMSRVWCGAFIRLIMRQSGHPDLRDGNLARAWARYGHPTAARPGAIAVMPHHVGIVARVVPGGVELVSGNSTGRRVAVGHYALGRFIAFRWPA